MLLPAPRESFSVALVPTLMADALVLTFRAGPPPFGKAFGRRCAFFFFFFTHPPGAPTRP